MDQNTRERFFPTYPGFRIARADDEVTHSRDRDARLRYTLAGDGECRSTFREWVDDGSNHGGVRSPRLRWDVTPS
jgi:hypothetical protein